MSLVKERQKLSANFNLLKREILFLDLREKTEIEILIKKRNKKEKQGQPLLVACETQRNELT